MVVSTQVTTVAPSLAPIDIVAQTIAARPLNGAAGPKTRGAVPPIVIGTVTPAPVEGVAPFANSAEAEERAASAILSAALSALSKHGKAGGLNNSIGICNPVANEQQKTTEAYQSEGGGFFGAVLMFVRIVFVGLALAAGAMFVWARIHGNRGSDRHSARGFGATSLQSWGDDDEDQPPGAVRSSARAAYDTPKGKGKGSSGDAEAGGTEWQSKPAPKSGPLNQSRTSSRGMQEGVSLEAMLAEQVRAL